MIGKLSRLVLSLGLASAVSLGAAESPAELPDGPPSKPNAAFSESQKPELVNLQKKLRYTIDLYRQQPYHADAVDPWSVLHAAIGLGAETKLRVKHPDGNSANAIGWLCYNHSCGGQRLLHSYQGDLYLPIAPGLQGHQGQFLSMLAQSRIPKDYTLQLGEHSRSVADLVAYEQRTCRSGTELTFKLIGLSHYLPSDAVWKNDLDETWAVSRLLAEELQQPIEQGACCGGTHRLMGLSYAVHRRQKHGEPLVGVWRQAQTRVVAYQARALEWQNADGSFSMNWFAGPGDGHDIEQKLNSSGHTLEWLAFSLPAKRLEEDALMRAASLVADLLARFPEHKWNAGAQGHAIHALRIYSERLSEEASKPRLTQKNETNSSR